jgi:hypothetical protein
VAKLYAPRVALVVLIGSAVALWDPVLRPVTDTLPSTDRVMELLTNSWVWPVSLLALIAIWFLMPEAKAPVFLLDFAVFRPPESWKCSHEDLIEICR